MPHEARPDNGGLTVRSNMCDPQDAARGADAGELLHSAVLFDWFRYEVR